MGRPVALWTVVLSAHWSLMKAKPPRNPQTPLLCLPRHQALPPAAMAAAPLLKPPLMSRACLIHISAPSFRKKPPRPILSLWNPSRTFDRLSRSSLSSPAAVSLVANTSDFELDPYDLEGEEEEEEPLGFAGEGGEDEGAAAAKAEFDGVDGIADERMRSYNPPKETKIFVGNLPDGIDSEKLARLFQEVGFVEVCEVIHSSRTKQSRSFGFITMGTAEEAEKAIDRFNYYEMDGRLLRVNKAEEPGTLRKRAMEYDPSLRVYVGGLPWHVTDTRLQKAFEGHGRVADAVVVYDRETGRSRGFGFVTMSTRDEVDNVVAAFDGQNFGGLPIKVSIANERPKIESSSLKASASGAQKANMTNNRRIWRLQTAAPS